MDVFLSQHVYIIYFWQLSLDRTQEVNEMNEKLCILLCANLCVCVRAHCLTVNQTWWYIISQNEFLVSYRHYSTSNEKKEILVFQLASRKKNRNKKNLKQSQARWTNCNGWRRSIINFNSIHWVRELQHVHIIKQWIQLQILTELIGNERMNVMNERQTLAHSHSLTHPFLVICRRIHASQTFEYVYCVYWDSVVLAFGIVFHSI